MHNENVLHGLSSETSLMLKIFMPFYIKLVKDKEV